MQHQTQPSTDLSAMLGPAIGIGMQTVVHMDRAQAASPRRRQCGERMQQNARIQATAEADHDRLRRQGLRSEEHTSELQPLMRISYAVFCLQKKKKTSAQQTIY